MSGLEASHLRNQCMGIWLGGRSCGAREGVSIWSSDVLLGLHFLRTTVPKCVCACMCVGVRVCAVQKARLEVGKGYLSLGI